MSVSINVNSQYEEKAYKNTANLVNNDTQETLLSMKTNDSPVQLSTSSGDNVETYEAYGVVIKVTKLDPDSSFSLKKTGGSNAKQLKLQIRAKNCIVDIVSSDDDNVEITTCGSNLTVNSHSSVKKLTNSAKNSTINGTSGDDYIINRGRNCVINAEAGNDKIINRSSNTTVNAGDGNDNIKNSSQNCEINAGDGDDTIKNTGGRTTINAGSGNDNIDNQAGSKGVVINGDEGNDIIQSRGFGFTINGGAGDDEITITSKNYFTNYSTKGKEEVNQKLKEQRLSKVDAGAGNDTITNSAYYIDIDNAEENDNITIIQPEDKHPCGQNTLFARIIDTKINYKNENTQSTSKETSFNDEIKNAKTVDDIKRAVYLSSNDLSYEIFSKIMEMVSSLQNDANLEELKRNIENLL